MLFLFLSSNVVVVVLPLYSDNSHCIVISLSQILAVLTYSTRSADEDLLHYKGVVSLLIFLFEHVTVSSWMLVCCSKAAPPLLENHCPGCFHSNLTLTHLILLMRFSPRPSHGCKKSLGKGWSESRKDCGSPGAGVLPLRQTRNDRMSKIAVNDC